MEILPFDGIGIVVISSQKVPLERNLLAPRALYLEDFHLALEDLSIPQWERFTDNFVTVILGSTRQDQNFNWFDDRRWETIVHNWQVAATVARRGRCKGLLIDPEHYGFKPFDYATQKQRIDQPFGVYSKIVRQRGRDVMTAMRSVFPDITLFFLFGHTLPWHQISIMDYTLAVMPIEKSEYGLYPAFLDGLLEAATPRSILIDGYEYAYGFKEGWQFARACEDIRSYGLKVSTMPETYNRFVKVGFGLWLDKGGAHYWNPGDTTANYFHPAEFEQALRTALAYSDRYVWIYSQTPRPFPLSNFPEAYLTAITRARQEMP
jgi:hypothetical protein